MGILSGWLQRRRDRRDEERFQDYYGELLNQQNFQQGVVEPATRGIGILPGVNSITAGADSGAIPIDPEGGGARDIMNRGGNITPPSMDLLRHPVYGQMARDLFMEAVKNNPAILAAKNRQELQQEIQKAILSATGTKVDQNLLGLDELEKTAKNPSLLPRERILQNLAEKEGITTTATEQAKEPFRDASLERQLKYKQSPTYKQMTGGGGGGEGGSYNVPQDFLNRAEKEILRDKSGAYSSTTGGGLDPKEEALIDAMAGGNPQMAAMMKRDAMQKSKAKAELTDRGLRVMQIAEEIAAKSKNRQPLSIINEAKAREKKEFKEQSKASALQGAQRPGIQINPNPAPATPAAPERAKEVQTGRDPATENKIKAAKSLGATDAEIKQSLIDEGKNPADYGYR